MLKKSLALCLAILLVLSLGGAALAAEGRTPGATIEWSDAPGDAGLLSLPDAAGSGNVSNPINVAGD